MFSGFGYGMGYYDDDESHRDFDDTPVEFFRPDGDTESKDVQWCLDNDFFQVEDGLWSGDWYYKEHPEERCMHQQRLDDTKKIRRMNEIKYKSESSRLYNRVRFGGSSLPSVTCRYVWTGLRNKHILH